MKYIVNAEEMKAADEQTSVRFKIPSLVLMERAALETAQIIEEYMPEKAPVLVVAGNGNNGGDGLAVGRILSKRGYPVFFYMPGDETKCSLETAKQIEIIKAFGMTISHTFADSEYAMVIDALFGISLNREIQGNYATAIHQMNKAKETGARIVSIDIPSGIHSDSGKIMGCCVQADLTVTYEYIKAGHLFYPGKEMCGKLILREIGIAGPEQLPVRPSYFGYEKEDIVKLLPKRCADGNKGTFGKLLVIGGSRNMAGAAYLCAKGAMLTGAGMVKICTCEENRMILQTRLPEALLTTYDTLPAEEEMEVQRAMDFADVLVIGPGLSMGETAQRLLELSLRQKKKMVMDADALNMISGNSFLRQLVKEYPKGDLILTPHPGEAARMLGKSIAEYKVNMDKELHELAGELGCVIAGKDAVTRIVSCDHAETYINLSGNDGMATAGSGDVLAGITGALFHHMEAFEAACLGSYIHGLAGDLAAQKKGNRSMTASDILEAIGGVLR